MSIVGNAVSILTDESGALIGIARPVRDDPLGAMYADNAVNADQFQAGRRWQACHEEIHGRLHYVDGRWIPKAVITRDLKRVGGRPLQVWNELRRMESLIGPAGASLLRDVLGGGHSIKAAAAMRGEGRCQKGWQRVFGCCLTKLARATAH